MNYNESVAYMNGLLRFGEKYGNERFEALLRRLGDPHYKLRALHIAGTKGKGSTTTFAASVLSAAHYKTGSYLSPYVYDLRERIQIDGKMISAEDFARWVTLIRPHTEALNATEFGQTTEFELKTAVAFCWFAEQEVDYAVIEVGLGGRLDATNVLSNPLVSVITTIGYDHMDILGDTLELIAMEKAGIVKRNGLCVTGVEEGPALRTIQAACEKLGAKLVRVVEGVDWRTERDDSLTIQTHRRVLPHLKLAMRGRFQHGNAAVALCAIDQASIPSITDEAARAGIESAFAPGRMEVIRASGPTVILDAAHNEIAARALADSLIKEFLPVSRPVIIVVGFSKRHDPADLLRVLKPLSPVKIIATEPSFRPCSAHETAEAAKELGFADVEVITPVSSAAKAAIKIAGRLADALVLVTGSFFTVGDLPPAERDSLFDTV